MIVRVVGASTSVHVLFIHKNFVQILGCRECKRLLTQHHVFLSDDHRFDQQLGAVFQIFDLGALFLRKAFNHSYMDLYEISQKETTSGSSLIMIRL